METLSVFWNLVPITLLQGVIYGFVALGIMVPFRMLSFPDLTAEGSFPLGGAVAAAAIAGGLDPIPATALAVSAGMLAGSTTALIHLTLKLNTLLCGIIVLTMLFSINIRVMGTPNTPLFAYDNMFHVLLGGAARVLEAQIALVAGLVLATAGLLFAYLKTEAGLALRAVGANQMMARAQGISIWRQTVWGIALAGGLCALGGAIVAQNQSFADVNMGFGVLLNGLAAVIVGETLVGRATILRQVLAPVVGAVVYYQAISFALALGLAPSDLKLLTGLFVLLMLAVPSIRGRRETLRIRE
ncbi:MAG: ABC transporter permease [Rhodobacteraceae bacterium]|jgi:putative ABC transport system permease protein|nr:ABC transporter permease [Paracoccaceae bacterium]